MIKVYYGNGSCNLSGGNARYITLFYRGAIEIDDKTPKGFEILASPSKIRIFPALNPDTKISTLFNYVGDFSITKSVISDSKGERLESLVSRVADLSEFILSNPEDMTILSEDMNATLNYKKTVSKTTLKQHTMDNHHTSMYGKDLYLPNREIYSGDIHIHKDTMRMMTGASHDGLSKNLYYYDADKRFTITGTRNGEANIFKKNRERKIKRRK